MAIILKYTREDVEQLVKAAEDLWRAHGVVVSNGGTGWARHVEPAIHELKIVAQKFNPAVVYAAGFFQGRDKETGSESWGMFDGPTPDLWHLVDTCIPPHANKLAYILKMTKDGDTIPLKEWDWDTMKWENY